MLECKHITKAFGDFKALDDVSVTVPAGKIFGLLGPNGAGKTTLIRIINRITIPSAGEVILDGKHVTDEDVRAIGYLPEERGLFKKMKVGEQSIYLARLKGMSTAAATAELKKGSSRMSSRGRCRTVVMNWTFCAMPLDSSSTFLSHQLWMPKRMNHFLSSAVAAAVLMPLRRAR